MGDHAILLIPVFAGLVSVALILQRFTHMINLRHYNHPIEIKRIAHYSPCVSLSVYINSSRIRA